MFTVHFNTMITQDSLLVLMDNGLQQPSTDYPSGFWYNSWAPMLKQRPLKMLEDGVVRSSAHQKVQI